MYLRRLPCSYLQVSEVSKRSAELWRALPAHERAHWDELAAKDKQRYMMEKASYTGPWQVPWKRAKKVRTTMLRRLRYCTSSFVSSFPYTNEPYVILQDPSAPKRPMSAFLYYSQEKRREIKESNPELRNTEISRLLGKMWREAPDEERAPHIEKEKEEREKYKVRIEKWRNEYDERMEEQRKIQAEQAAHAATVYGAQASTQDATQSPEQAQYNYVSATSAGYDQSLVASSQQQYMGQQQAYSYPQGAYGQYPTTMSCKFLSRI